MIRAAALLAAVALALPALASATAPSRQPGATHVNERPRPTSLGDDGENDYAGVLLLGLVAVVVLVVIPTQLAKGVTRRREEANRMARSGRATPTNDA